MTTTTDTAAPPTTPAQMQEEARPEIEKHREDGERQARQTIDKEAVEAIEETRNALRAAADGKIDEAIAAIERATGKIDVLTARSPQAALLPVDADALIIDTAPREIDAIRRLGTLVDSAVLVRDFPLARVVLGRMVSEIRIRTYHLPMAIYPAFLRNAARALDAKDTGQARTLLQAALNSLVVIDRAVPLPLVVAQVAVSAAEGLRDQDRDAAGRLLSIARSELERGMELGYMGKDDEYKALSRAISDLEKQLKGNENTTSAFAKLKERLAQFFRRISESEKSSQGGKDGQAEQGSRTVNQQTGNQQTASPERQPAGTTTASQA